MNWLNNVSSDSDQPIAAACLVQGHWRHRLHPYADPVLCHLVIDLAAPRVVAAQVIEPGQTEDLDLSDLEDLTQVLLDKDVHHRPAAWGFVPCPVLPTWARPTFSEQQIEELERIQGYLIEATDDTIQDVLRLREDFLRGIGMTDQHIMRATRAPDPSASSRKGNRSVN
jgi:hypothetical protein